VRWKMLI